MSLRRDEGGHLSAAYSVANKAPGLPLGARTVAIVVRASWDDSSRDSVGYWKVASQRRAQDRAREAQTHVGAANVAHLDGIVTGTTVVLCINDQSGIGRAVCEAGAIAICRSTLLYSRYYPALQERPIGQAAVARLSHNSRTIDVVATAHGRLQAGRGVPIWKERPRSALCHGQSRLTCSTT